MRGLNGVVLSIILFLAVAAMIYVYAQLRLNYGVGIGTGTTLRSAQSSSPRASSPPSQGGSGGALPVTGGVEDNDDGCVDYTFVSPSLESLAHKISVPNCDVNAVLLQCSRQTGTTIYFKGVCFGRQGIWRIDTNAGVSGEVPPIRPVLRKILHAAGVHEYLISYSAPEGMYSTSIGSVVLGGYHDCDLTRLLPELQHCDFDYGSKSLVTYYDPETRLGFLCMDRNYGTAILVTTTTPDQQKKFQERCG